jgi:hypothetical protein
MAIRCAECRREADDFTAIAEGWRYYSDGTSGLMPFCPACARREFAPDAPASGLAPSTGAPAKLVATRRNFVDRGKGQT